MPAPVGYRDLWLQNIQNMGSETKAPKLPKLHSELPAEGLSTCTKNLPAVTCPLEGSVADSRTLVFEVPHLSREKTGARVSVSRNSRSGAFWCNNFGRAAPFRTLSLPWSLRTRPRTIKLSEQQSKTAQRASEVSYSSFARTPQMCRTVPQIQNSSEQH